MAVIRKTTFRCDACGKEVPAKRDLVSIRVEKGTHSQHRWSDTVVGVKTDLCDGCEKALLENLKGFFGEGVYETLRRAPKREKPAAKTAKS